MKYLIFLYILVFPTILYADRGRLTIVTSSTVSSFARSISEEYAISTANLTPIVESMDTTPSIKNFCNSYADMAFISRKIRQTEIDLCNKNNIKSLYEFVIGYDGIVIVNSPKSPKINFTKKDLSLALGYAIPKNGTIIVNDYITWNQINPTLPKTKIEFYGPSKDSATFHHIVNEVLIKSCLHKREFQEYFANIEELQRYCGKVRKDGAYIEIPHSTQKIILNKIDNNTTTFAAVTYSYFNAHSNKLQTVTLENVEPSMINISNKKYPLSRPMYLYINASNISAEVIKYLKFIKSSNILSGNTPIAENGFITLNKESYTDLLSKIDEIINK